MTVVGDIHGQLQDLFSIFTINGLPCPQNHYIFNGDFVDRGPCGAEVLFTLCAFKVLAGFCGSTIRTAIRLFLAGVKKQRCYYEMWRTSTGSVLIARATARISPATLVSRFPKTLSVSAQCRSGSV